MYNVWDGFWYSLFVRMNEMRDNTDSVKRDCLMISNVPNRYVNYYLNSRFSSLEGHFFLTHAHRNSRFSCDVKIWADGELVYEYQHLSNVALRTQPQLELNVQGVETLRIGIENLSVENWFGNRNAPLFGLADAKLYP